MELNKNVENKLGEEEKQCKQIKLENHHQFGEI
jgi:hypothetical protein